MGRRRRNYDGDSEFLTRMGQVRNESLVRSRAPGISLHCSPRLALGSIELKEMTKIMTCLLELEGIGKVEDFLQWKNLPTPHNKFLGCSKRESHWHIQPSWCEWWRPGGACRVRPRQPQGQGACLHAQEEGGGEGDKGEAAWCVCCAGGGCGRGLETRNSSQICHRDMRDILQDLFTSQCFRQWLTFSLAGDWLRGPGALITNYQSYLHFIISEPHTPDCPSDRLSVIECDNPNSQSTNITEWQLTHGAT